MTIGIFIIIPDQVSGPVISTGYFHQKINLSQDSLEKLYRSHVECVPYMCIETIFPEYKILSCYTGMLSESEEKEGKEGILALVFEPNASTSNFELFLRQNLLLCITDQTTDLLESLLECKVDQYRELISLFNNVDLEFIELMAIIQCNKDIKSVLVRLGQNTLTNNEIIRATALLRNSLDHIYISFLGEKEGSEYLIMIQSKKGTEEQIKLVFDRISPYLKDHIENFWEILSMLLFPQLITFLSNEKLGKQISYNPKKSLLSNLKLANKDHYQVQFYELLSAVIKGRLYPVPLY